MINCTLKNCLIKLDSFYFFLFPKNLIFRNRLIDGTEVIYETSERRSLQEESPRKGPDESPSGHHDCVTDVALTRVPQNFLISGSKDGVVKVWK